MSEYSGTVASDNSPSVADSKEPKFSCSINKSVIGVAAVSPVAWSSDGAWFVHATGDNSLHVCSKPGSSTAFKVHGVLVGHRATVTCMVVPSF
jgi:WD40 repeat protein